MDYNFHKGHNTEKETNSTLQYSEWNNLADDVNNLCNALETLPTPTSVADTVVSVSSKGNTQISSAKHINLEPAYDAEGNTEGTYGDIQIKPGDDITLESSHRATNKRDEITVKTTNGLSGGSKSSVKLQVKASELTLSTEGKKVEQNSNDATNVMNINVTTGSGKGYLKVRAQAIDLRCEDNGGIALQPKGEDGSGHENKIKFEHDGGDGKEFGTFNTEKTSIFTDEYRFNVAGEVYAVTRGALETTYKVPNDPNSGVKKIDYPTQSDDFKDIIDNNTPHCSWGDIIKFIAWAKANAAGSAWENLWSAPL